MITELPGRRENLNLVKQKSYKQQGNKFYVTSWTWTRNLIFQVVSSFTNTQKCAHWIEPNCELKYLHTMFIVILCASIFCCFVYISYYSCLWKLSLWNSLQCNNQTSSNNIISIFITIYSGIQFTPWIEFQESFFA